MAAVDETVSKDVVEKMRLRYRKEAMAAVEEAETRGYESGRKEAQRAADKEIKYWKAIAEGVTSNSNGKSKPTTLVKLVMEQIYRDVKREFSGYSNNEEVLVKMKTALVNSTNEIMRIMPEIVLSNNLVSTASAAADAVGVVGHGVSFQKKESFKADVYQARSHLYFVRSKWPPPRYFLNVSIPEVIDNTKKSVFGGSSGYVSYKIETEIVSLNHSAYVIARSITPSSSCVTVEKRHSELKTLQQQLAKQYPALMIPVLPISQRDEGTDIRKRSFIMWLQYVSNIDLLQKDSTFVKFLTALPQLESVSVASTGNNSGTSRYNKGAAAAATRGRSQQQQQQRCDDDRVGAVTVFTGCFQQVLSERADKKNSAAFEDISPENMYTRKLVAYQDLQTFTRDLSQLEPNAKSVIESSRLLCACITAHANSYESMATVVNNWSRCEPASSFELNSLQVLSTAIQFTAPHYKKMGEILTDEMYSYFCFLEGDCLEAARETLGRITKLIPLSSFAKHSSHSIAGSSTSSAAVGRKSISAGDSLFNDSEVERDSYSGGNSGHIHGSNVYAEDNEKLKEVTTATKCWDATRRIRSSMMLTQLMVTAKGHMNEHRECVKQWESAFQQLGGISRKRNPVGLEKESRSLKMAIQSELHSYDEASTRLQDDLAKIKTAGKGSVQAAMERPVLPAGVRRDPSTVKSPLPGAVHDKRRKTVAFNNNNIDSEETAGGSRSQREQRERQGSRKRGERDVTSNEEDTAADSQGKQRSTSTGRAPRRGSGGTGSATNSNNQQQQSSTGGLHRAPVKGQSAVPTNVFGESVKPAVAAARQYYSGQQHQYVPGVPGKEKDTAASSNPASSTATATAAATATTGGVFTRKSAAHSGAAARRSSNPSQAFTTTAAATTSTTNDDENDDAKKSNVRRRNSGASGADQQLPEGWEQVNCEDGSSYYYHVTSRLSRWERPSEKFAASHEAKLNKASAEVDEAVLRRKQEMEQERQLAESRATETQVLQTKIKKMVGLWRTPMGARRERDIAELLSTVHQIVSFIPENAIVNSAQIITTKSPPSEIKRAYMKAVRFVHPDKLPESIDLESALTAEAAFIVLTDSFNAFRSMIEAQNS